MASWEKYDQLCPWLEGTKTQWGSNGVVLGKNPYRTAFFEAFPPDASFLRGEGKTITEAEQDAFAQYQKVTACNRNGGHLLSRNRGKVTYKNGAGFCKQTIPPIQIAGTRDERDNALLP
ncbi:MAG: hypothetical protein OIF56_14845 [Cohaesibacter sp.]|nr:hypothetical protein [Cohaesibacter sp.]